MKTVFFEIEDWETDILQAALGDRANHMTKLPLTTDNVDDFQDAEVISCFLYSDLRGELLSRMKNLKLITTRSTGTDHIDLGYCNAQGITVVNVPAYGEHTVAEHVFALLLGLSRQLIRAVRRTREGNFSFKGLLGFDLHGKTMGLIGSGVIGRHVARIAQGFGMNVVVFDAYPNPETGLNYVTFEDLLKQADVISLHVPATPQTFHLLSDKEFSLMKDGVVIINTARGSVMNVKALFSALKSGKVAGAGLDVLPEEPAIHEEAELLRSSFAQDYDTETVLADYALLNQKNVYVTPHSAFYTREALEKILNVTADNILSFEQARPMNVVNSP